MWSLGVMTHVLVTGTVPFWGSNNQAIFKKVVKMKFDPFQSRWCSHLSQSCKEFLLNLLDKDPEKRMTAEEAWVHPWVTGETAGTGEIGAQTDAFLRLYMQHCQLKMALAQHMVDQLTDEERAELRSVFDAADTNGDGFLDRSEVKVMIQGELGYEDEVAEDVALKLVSYMNDDADARIDFDEFCRAHGARRLGMHVGNLETIFKGIDSEGAGKIGAPQLEMLFGSVYNLDEVSMRMWPVVM